MSLYEFPLINYNLLIIKIQIHNNCNFQLIYENFFIRFQSLQINH